MSGGVATGASTEEIRQDILEFLAQGGGATEEEIFAYVSLREQIRNLQALAALARVRGVELSIGKDGNVSACAHKRSKT